MKVTVIQEDRMPLLGLIFKAILERSFQTAWKARMASRMGGEVRVQAGRMIVYLLMEEEEWSIGQVSRGQVVARVKGTLTALTSVAAGRLPLSSFMKLDLLPWGNPFVLLKIFLLIRG